MSLDLGNLWTAYLKLLETQPVSTKCLTTAFLSMVSDVLAQGITRKQKDDTGKVVVKSWDVTSVIHKGVLGLCFTGPMVHYWYEILGSIFKSWPADAWSTAIAQTLVDQIVFAPVINGLYFFAVGVLRGDSLETILRDFKAQYANVMIGNYKLWPAVNLINFGFVPANLRMLFGNLVSIFWSAFLSIATAASPKPKAIADKPAAAAEPKKDAAPAEAKPVEAAKPAEVAKPAEAAKPVEAAKPAEAAAPAQAAAPAK